VSAAPIDYDALAKQNGAIQPPVDYDALAKQHGAIETSSTGIAAPQGTEGTGHTGRDLLTGVAEGAANTTGNLVSGAARLINKIPYVGETLAPEQGIKALEARTEERSKPANEDESLGRTGEQIAEWMIPTGAEEKAGAMAAEHLPQIARFIRPAAKIATGAMESGLRNTSQGGEFSTGAEFGAGTGILGEGMRAAAPPLAESALGISKRLRGYGKTPGLAALEETRGIRPETIERTAQEKLGGLTSQINNQAAVHPGTVSLQPALDRIDTAIKKATSQNDAATVKQLSGVRDALTTEIGTGIAIPPDVTAERGLNLKRGLRTQFVSNWNPEVMHGTKALAAGASGDIDRVLDNALGRDFAERNQRISSLIPVAERAESEGRNAGIGQRSLHRIAAHTGASALALGGGAYGYHEGGIPGMIKYGTLGILAPEVLTSPEAEMLAARTLYSPATSRGMRAALPLLRSGVKKGDKETE
jgi:hypothetical protein